MIVNVSDLDINGPAPIYNRVLKMIEEKKFSDELFDELETVVEVNLYDVLCRFRFSSSYSTYLQDVEIANKMLGL